MVKLRKMSLQEFKKFKQYSIADYANDLMKSGNISYEEAIRQSEKEFMEMVPQGFETPNNALMIIENSASGEKVGIIWYLFEVTDGVKHTFLNDFIINEEQRRKGYATAALLEMELDAKKSGCTECRLYVWEHNLPGIQLYTKCGYSSFRQEDGGVYMTKVL